MIALLSSEQDPEIQQMILVLLKGNLKYLDITDEQFAILIRNGTSKDLLVVYSLMEILGHYAPKTQDQAKVILDLLFSLLRKKIFEIPQGTGIMWGRMGGRGKFARAIATLRKPAEIIENVLHLQIRYIKGDEFLPVFQEESLLNQVRELIQMIHGNLEAKYQTFLEKRKIPPIYTAILGILGLLYEFVGKSGQSNGLDIDARLFQLEGNNEIYGIIAKIGVNFPEYFIQENLDDVLEQRFNEDYENRYYILKAFGEVGEKNFHAIENKLNFLLSLNFTKRRCREDIFKALVQIGKNKNARETILAYFKTKLDICREYSIVLSFFRENFINTIIRPEVLVQEVFKAISTNFSVNVGVYGPDANIRGGLKEWISFLLQEHPTLITRDYLELLQRLKRGNLLSRENDVLLEELNSKSMEEPLVVESLKKSSPKMRRWSKRLQIPTQRIEDWLNNFQPNEQDLASRLLDHIDYINEEMLRDMCKNLYRDILEATKCNKEDRIFVSLGDEAKSAQVIAYLFRQSNSIPKKQFMDKFDPDLKKLKEKVIIYLDDISVTGDQFLGDWKMFKKKLGGEFLSFNTFIFAPIFITEVAKKRISKKLKKINIIYLGHHLLTDKNIALNENAHIYSKQELKTAKEIFTKHGKRLRPKAPLGYGNLGLLIVFFHNPPNGTLPIIWQSSRPNSPWVPLYPRYASVK